MRLSAPKKGVFTISVILMILGLIGSFIPLGNSNILDLIQHYSFLLTFIGGVLLALGCMLKGF